MRWLLALVVVLVAGCAQPDGGPAAPVEASEPAPPAPVVVLATYRFEGLLPADGSTVARHAFEVPANASELTLDYTSDYVGLFPAVATLVDLLDRERARSLDTCPVAVEPGANTRTCSMAVRIDVLEGPWTAQVQHQVGQVAEGYTLDIVVHGVA